MVAFPQLLEYTTTRIDLMVDCDGNARLVEGMTAVREWTAKCARAVHRRGSSRSPVHLVPRASV